MSHMRRLDIFKSIENLKNGGELMINIIDAPCGSGKTTAIINKINAEEYPVVFVTPFLTEVDRIESSCPRMVAPVKDNNSTKLDDFKALLADGKSIVTTHSLFKGFDQECYDLIKSGKYHLVLDEVVSTVSSYPLKHSDIKMMLDTGKIKTAGDYNELVWLDNEYDGMFNPFKKSVMRGDVYLVDISDKKQTVYWELPLDKFINFSEITILTYLFEGQEMSCYFKMYNLPYTLYSMKDHKIVPYDKHTENREELKKLINVFDGKANKNFKGTLSATYYSNKKNVDEIKQLKKNAESYMKNTTKASVSSIMWSCYGSDINKLKDKRCTVNNHVPFNSRATNDYRDRTNLAYMINVYLDPSIVQYFSCVGGVTLDQDLYAVSTLIQWICRSAVREGKPVNLYLPSARMRDLLNKFFNYEL